MMTTFNAYYRVTVRKDGGTAAEWKTNDSIEALKFFKNYVDTYSEANAAFRKTNPNTSPYKIYLDVVDDDTYMFMHIKSIEV